VSSQSSGGLLFGRHIVITRTRRQAAALASSLRAEGAEVIELPTIEIVPPESYQPLDEALRSLGRYQWLIVTSANTVRVIGARLAFLGIEAGALSKLRIAAIGSATAEALAALGAPPSLLPEQYVAESLIAAFHGLAEGKRVLLARASVARDVIPDELAAMGANVDVVDAYRTVVPKESAAAVRELFSGKRALPDAITFTSSSTVKHFFSLLKGAAIELPPNIAAISIGPITSTTLREHGWKPAAEADPHNVEGLFDATVGALKAKPDRSG